MVLFGADRVPVAGTVGVPLADVGGRIDVAETGHAAVGTGHVRAVDDDLVAGEQGEGAAGGGVVAGEETEGHVIAGGVLDTRQNPVQAQFEQQGAG